MNDKSKFNPQIHHRRSIRLKGYNYSQAGMYFITICCQDRICRFGDIVGASLADAQNVNNINVNNINVNNINEKVQPQGFAPKEGKMILNEYGKIAFNEWIKLTNRFLNCELDVFQIMPNHLHGILILKNVAATLALAQNDDIKNNFQLNDFIERVNYDNKSEADHKIRDGSNKNIKEGTNNKEGANDIIRAGASPAPTISDIVGAYKSLVSNACLEIFKSNNEIMGKLWQRNYYEHLIRDEQSYQTISNYIICNPMKWKEDKFYM